MKTLTRKQKEKLKQDLGDLTTTTLLDEFGVEVKHRISDGVCATLDSLGYSKDTWLEVKRWFK